MLKLTAHSNYRGEGGVFYMVNDTFSFSDSAYVFITFNKRLDRTC